MTPEEQGTVVEKYDTGGQEEPTPKKIPDDCIAVSVSSESALNDEPIDKDTSPYYEQRPDGGYNWIGLDS